MRRLVRALAGAGADFGGLPARYPVEWGTLTEPGPGNASALADLALSASERRLLRESEQTHRVLSVAASAVCRGAESLDMPVLLRGLGQTDLPSLRGLVRVAEYGSATGLGRLCVAPSDARQVAEPGDPAADTRAERARCLTAMGVEVVAGDLQPVRAGSAAGSVDGSVDGAADELAGESTLFVRALDDDTAPAERMAAALAYSRASFYASNWEGMALVAATCLPVAAVLTSHDVDRLAQSCVGGGLPRLGADPGELPGPGDQAIEFEPALLRHPGDLTAYLLKVLGVQASFRGFHEQALRFFRAMRDAPGPLAAETVAQSHLYAALTLAKRQHRLPEAVVEVDAGLEAVAERSGEPASVRRERGWLHNLRGLTLFREGRYLAAMEQARTALACVEGDLDAGADQLRVNLVSNISVLQETAGSFDQALQTWHRFRVVGAVGADEDAKFVKHHAYRCGGLRIAAGDVDGGLPELVDSLQRCVQAADDFHEYEIAAELGTLMLGRQERTAASGYFEQAGLAATRLGDPYRMAVAAVGRAGAAGQPLGEHTAALARASRTQTSRAAALLDGCRDGVDVQTLLPAPRTRLNRPFDLVNV
jgi:tetratricopeptide (TPR) repeat protein